jgi:transcriptional regulator with XRE-family HTH domain
MTTVKIERIKRGLRQTDVATLTGGIVPQHRLSLLERGVRPRPEEIKALSDAFQLDPAELFKNA